MPREIARMLATSDDHLFTRSVEERPVWNEEDPNKLGVIVVPSEELHNYPAR